MKSTTLLATCTLASILATAAEPFQWGVNGHPMSQEGYFHVPITNQLDLISELGAGWYRVDLGAKQFAADTERFDRLLSEAAKRNLRLLPVLFPSPDARSGAPAAKIREAASNFACAVAARYKGRITHWELSNELDAHAMIAKGEVDRAGKVWKWDGSPDGSSPGHYHEGRYQQAKAEILGLYEGLKAADPGAVTIVDTAGWLHYGFIDRLVKEDHVPFDVLSWHWYSEMGDMRNVQGRLDLIGLLATYGRPLTITEINRRDGSKGGKEEEQAGYLKRAARQLGGSPSVTGFFVYELFDEPYFGESGESHYGLVGLVRDEKGRWRPGSRKPAFAAFREEIALSVARRRPE